MVDLELTEPLPTIALRPDERGLGVLMRRNDRPVLFFLHALPPSTVLTPDRLGRLVSEAGAVDLVEEAVREQLAEPVDHTSRPRVTVAVCTRRRPEELAACLESVLRLRPDDPRSLDVLVVDNDTSAVETEQLVAALAGVRYAREPIPGLDFARNRALREATGDLVAFLDDDVVVDRGWLAGLEEAIAEHPDAAAVTGMVLPFELATRAQRVFERRGGFGRGFEKLRYAGPRLPYNSLYPCGSGMFGAGCNMVLRRDVALQLGGFDEALDTGPPLPGGGDLDIFYRVVRAGFPLVYEPRMAAFHKHRRENAALRRQYYTWGTGFMAFAYKTYLEDPSQRGKLRRLVRWWLLAQARELRRSTRGRGPLSPDLVLAELGGGLMGLAGEYPRSVRRTRRLRA